jgi:3,4-dihydroxy 2-butanone 4-phosphate synthase/GTP cyclohydrolase II
MQRIAREGNGVIVVLREAESPRELADAVQSLRSQGDNSRISPAEPSGGPVLRTYGIGAQILKDLGLRRMRVLSAPKQMHGLSAFDLEVVSYVDSES